MFEKISKTGRTLDIFIKLKKKNMKKCPISLVLKEKQFKSP